MGATTTVRPATLDPGATRQVDDVVSIVRHVLGDDAIGAYLYGSAVVGGLRPSSDLDVLVVSTRATTPADGRALIDRLLAISGARAASGPARSIELTIVVQSDVRPWRYPPRLDFQYGDWWRSEFERGDVAPWQIPNPDLAVLLAMVLRGGKPLFGPSPPEVLDPVPRGDLVRAMLAEIPDLLADLESDTRNVILTLARIWTTVATGTIRSKDAAADWALERLPAARRPGLAHARAGYRGRVDERGDDQLSGVRPLADHLVAEIERAASARRAATRRSG